MNKFVNLLIRVMPDKSDLLLFAGMGSLFYGIYQLHPPSAFCVTGVLFIGIGLLNAFPSKKVSA